MLWHAPHNCTESAGRVPERAESQLRPVNFPKSQTSLVTPSNNKKTHTHALTPHLTQAQCYVVCESCCREVGCQHIQINMKAYLNINYKILNEI